MKMPKLPFLLLMVGLIYGQLGTPCQAQTSISFTHDVIPVLTRFGCNSGGCHGKLAGQNGFKLSLRGYAPELDYDALARESRARRINFAAPEESLLVRKTVGSLPHGGGQRFSIASPAAKVLTDWIRGGAPGISVEEPRIERIEITPSTRTLSVGDTQPIQVTAHYDDGHSRDVTWMCNFASSDAGMLSVTESGIVQAERHGEAIIRIAFQGQTEIMTVTVPFERPSDPAWFTAKNNEIDRLVFEKLAALNIEPSPLCDDATFIRRAYLDAIGTLPRAEEVRKFISSEDPQKRSHLVDQLLERPEFIDFWALQLGDLLQNRKERDHDVRGQKGVRAMHQWIREQLIADRSWVQITRDVLTAQGSSSEHPEVGYFIVTVGEKEAEQSEAADSVAQAFLGNRIGCARCHNHPLEKFTQDDYYHFVGFFSRIALDRTKSDEGATALKLGTRHMLNLERQIKDKQKKIQEASAAKEEAEKIEKLEQEIKSLQEQIESNRKSPVQVRQPRTGEMLEPRPLDRSEIELAEGEDPRLALVDWMTDPENEYFSGAMVNRLWKHFLGVGLVEPVDDLRATNPPSNQALWKELNREFVSSDYDLKHVMRLIMNSRTYQLSAETRDSNFRDARFYSHFYARRLPAEVFLDAICQATDQPESFAGYPVGVRAIQVPDPGIDSYFLTLFDRSPRTTACTCEREGDVTLPQLLHLQNSSGLSDKITSPAGRLHTLLKNEPNDTIVTDELYLNTVSRLPSEEERTIVSKLINDQGRESAYLDLFWALMNSKEFAFNR